MSFSIVRKGISADGVATAANTFTLFYSATGASPGSAVGNGNAIAGYVATTPASSPVTFTAVDSASNTVHVADSVFDSAGPEYFISFYLQNITNSPTSVTITISGGVTGNFWRGEFIEISGMASSSPLLGHAMQVQTAVGTGTNALTSGATGTLAQSGGLVYGGTMNDLNGSAISAGTLSSFSMQNNGGGSVAVPLGDETFFPYNSTTGIAATFTAGSAGSNWITGVMVFAPAAAAASCPRTLMTLGVGCGISMIGWTPALLRSPLPILGGAALRLGKAARENATISRRSLLTGHNGGPKL